MRRVEVGHDLLPSIINFAKNYSSSAVITDDIVKKLYGKKFPFPIVSFKSGEKNKTRKTKEELEDALLALNMKRSSLLIAFGGGVVTDLAGFIAATYMRGIPFISVPTTLMGMVDASLGGKTGVNTPLGKNLIGAFYDPLKIFIDFSCLKTLPEDLLQEGLAEIIKYGLIASPSLFEHVEKKGFSDLEAIISMSIQIKSQIVEEDPYEKGVRRILNFGHTIAHALERLTGYTLSHGKALFYGLLIESALSCSAGLSPFSYRRVERLLHPFLSPIPSFSEKDWEKAFFYDKKREDHQIPFVLLESIGQISSMKALPFHRVKKELSLKNLLR